jgi:hypothetical protein
VRGQVPAPEMQRPRRPRVARALGAALLACSPWLGSVAGAQEESAALPRAEPTDQSPQSAALELRFGPYRPNIDDSTTRPVFDEFFGDKRRYLFGLELDWQIWRAPYVGTLGLGAGWGYAQISAPNVSAEPRPPTPPISQQSNLNIMPMYAVGVLRIDTLARNFNIPLVPYGKFGLAYALWWVNDGVATAETEDGVKGKDTSIGTQAALGAMFLLDVLEPSAARAMDSEGGVNNSYLFIEWSMSNFSGDQMDVGANTWVTGLAFEM